MNRRGPFKNKAFMSHDPLCSAMNRKSSERRVKDAPFPSPLGVTLQGPAHISRLIKRTLICVCR